MQYLALIYAEDGASPVPGDAEFDTYMQGYYDATKTFEEAGIIVYLIPEKKKRKKSIHFCFVVVWDIKPK